MTASPGDGEHAAREGYYPDPSIPGYVRFWNGLNWVPGTSRPAAPADETGPVFLDQTGMSEALREPERAEHRPRPRPAPAPAPASWPEPAGSAAAPAARSEVESWAESAARSDFGSWPAAGAADAAGDAGGYASGYAGGYEPGYASGSESGYGSGSESGSEPGSAAAEWQADPLHQSGFGGPRDRRVSWGHEEEAAARPGGISLARPSVPAPAPHQAAAPAPLRAQAPGQFQAQAPLQAQAQAPAPLQAQAQAAPAPAPAHRAAQDPAPARHSAPAPVSAALPAQASGSAAPGGLGILSAPSPVAAHAPAPARPGAPGADPEPAERVRRPERPAPAAPAEPARRAAPVEQADRAERAGAAVPAAPRPERTGRAVFERMAERAVRPAGLVRRATARLLDSLVYAAVATGVALPLVPGTTAHLEAKVDAARAAGRTTTVWLLDGTTGGSLGLVLGVVLLFGVFYEALPTARWGRTPGKKLLGVRVLATATLRPPRFGAALRRWLVYALLGLPGALWALADRQRRRTLHDRAARTYVAR
ncbi:RDD family protein [Streptomyces sp. NPDC002886]|uniref:RDD family protein n=1 Tax=Streptomyces sp. NPDC002886 TaxID=3364667 RepID=UPI00368F40D8